MSRVRLPFSSFSSDYACHMECAGLRTCHGSWAAPACSKSACFRMQAIHVAACNKGTTLVIRFSHGKPSVGPFSSDEAQSQLEEVTRQLQRVDSWLTTYEREKGILVDMLLDSHCPRTSKQSRSGAPGAMRVRQTSLEAQSTSLPRLMTSLARQGSSVVRGRQTAGAIPPSSAVPASCVSPSGSSQFRECLGKASAVPMGKVSASDAADDAATWATDAMQLALPPCSVGPFALNQQGARFGSGSAELDAQPRPVAEGRRSSSKTGLHDGSFVSFDNPLSEAVHATEGQSAGPSRTCKQVAFGQQWCASEDGQTEGNYATTSSIAAELACVNAAELSSAQVRFEVQDFYNALHGFRAALCAPMQHRAYMRSWPPSNACPSCAGLRAPRCLRCSACGARPKRRAYGGHVAAVSTARTEGLHRLAASRWRCRRANHLRLALATGRGDWLHTAVTSALDRGRHRRIYSQRIHAGRRRWAGCVPRGRSQLLGAASALHGHHRGAAVPEAAVPGSAIRPCDHAPAPRAAPARRRRRRRALRGAAAPATRPRGQRTAVAEGILGVDGCRVPRDAPFGSAGVPLPRR